MNDIMKKMTAMLSRKLFNLVKFCDDEVVEFYKMGEGIVLTEAEQQLAESLCTDAEAIETETASVLSRNGYGNAYSEALKDIEIFWESFMENKHPMNEDEKAKLAKLQKRVYDLRGLADGADDELKHSRKDWMSRFPLSKEKFAQYSELLGLEPGSVVSEHARLLIPCKLISKYNLQNTTAARQMVFEDFAEEINRDDWFNTDVWGVDGRDHDRAGNNGRETRTEEITRLVLKAFSWTGVDETCRLQDIADYLSEWDALFAGDVCTQRLSYLGITEEWVLPALLGTQERYSEYLKKSGERAAWRAQAEAGIIQDFSWDAYALGFGRQKNFFWRELGGTFKSAWGALLRFKSARVLIPTLQTLCENVESYSDRNAAEDKQPSSTYKGARSKIARSRALRKRLDNEESVEQTWRKKLVQLMIVQSDSFCTQLAGIEGKKLPEEKMNVGWNAALISGIPAAKARKQAMLRDMILRQDYSQLDDLYGSDASDMALSLMFELASMAKEAAQAQAKFIGDRFVVDTVESDAPEF